MQIDSTTQGGWTILKLAGPIDNAGAGELKAALLPHLSGGALALDFGGVDYVTSSGFRVLMQAERELRARQGRLLLGNMSEDVRHFFDIAGLSALFKIAPDLAAATGEGR